ncbi:blue-light-activated protein [Mariprofundus micogutta]|uniref:histidine kinase n=2 Tax=Mariprofundus micogutta TaxID=1921010 RepID=A0A1L8CQA7_9PROT|nr:blue-light-activated protein [Mariprofundus micogutta]
MMIMREQLLLLFSQAPQTFASSTIVSAVVTYVLWGHLNALQLAGWFIVICVINITRLVLIRSYRSHAERNGLQPERWLQRFTLITLAAGLTWGGGALLFLQQLDVTYQMFIVMILSGVSAGALATYSSSMVTYRVFIIGCFAIPAIWMVLQHEAVQVSAGILIMLYIALMWALNRRQYKSVRESMRLRYKNTDLLDHLESEVVERRLNEDRLLDSENKLKEKTAQLQSLLRLSQALEQSESHMDIIHAIEAEIERALGYQHAWIYLCGDDPDSWHLLSSKQNGDASIGPDKCLPAKPTSGDPVLEGIASATGPVVIEDARTDARTNKEIVNKTGNRTIINIPIILSNKRLGVLGTGSFGEEGVFSPEVSQLEHLSAMASHVALALDRINLFNERIDMQAQLEHSQRLDSLGLMAGGIAHDFNNILTSIMGSAAVADRHLLDDPESAQQNLSRIVDSSRRAADLCNQMLAYSGKGHFVVETVDLNQALSEIIPLLESAIGKHAEISYDLYESLPMVEVDIAQIQQVIMNLIINASEAITDSTGAITVKTGTIDADEAYLAHCFGDHPNPGSYVYMEISDTGCGMDSDTAERIFDPFFTTKFTGRGLGMSAILGIVRGHAGAIFLDSTLNKGTTFKVLFPALEICVVKEHPHEHVTAEVHADGEKLGTVLVVDDEEDVRELALTILQDDGFHVLTAEHGEEAVQVYALHQDEISLVLLDLTMPRMGGIECFAELQKKNSEVKVILVSGYSEDDVLGQFEGHKLSGFIKKPFMPDELMSTVSDQLAPDKSA